MIDGYVTNTAMMDGAKTLLENGDRDGACVEFIRHGAFGQNKARVENMVHEVRPGFPTLAAHPWDGYLTGPENELAMAAAQAMARGERTGISPLVVHGPSGVGKSRLLAGLVAEWLRRQPGSSVAHLDAQAFVTACLEAVPSRGASAGPP